MSNTTSVLLPARRMLLRQLASWDKTASTLPQGSGIRLANGSVRPAPAVGTPAPRTQGVTLPKGNMALGPGESMVKNVPAVTPPPAAPTPTAKAPAPKAPAPVVPAKSANLGALGHLALLIHLGLK